MKASPEHQRVRPLIESAEASELSRNVDDILDDVIRDAAPDIVREIREREVDEDIDEFIDGAIHGSWDTKELDFADPPNVGDSTEVMDSGDSEEVSEMYRLGYQWGWDNPSKIESGEAIPDSIRAEMIEYALSNFKGRVTEEFVINALEKATGFVKKQLGDVHHLLMKAKAKFGWKFAPILVSIEVIEHAILPAALGAIHPIFYGLTAIPTVEILAASALAIAKARMPSVAVPEIPPGHLDWYEDEYRKTANESALRMCIREIITEKTLRGQKAKRVLYHIAMSGPKPPRPIPKMKWIMEWDAQAVDRHTGEKTGEDVRIAPDNSWKRHWLDQPVESGIFLSPNWKAISSFHGRIGHVYAFKVPEWVIKKAGGIHRYDHGSEILISEEIWNEAGDEIEFLGKSVDVDDVFDAYEHSYGDTSATVNRRGTPRSPSWLDAEELEAWKAKQKEFNLYGLRQTNHPKDVIKLLKPDEVKAAMVAFEKEYPEALTGKKHKIEWKKDSRGGKGFPSLTQIAERPISTKDQELIDLLKKRMSESVVRKMIREIL